jgi:RNA polymerase sigma-70 factor, ECF subfamily
LDLASGVPDRGGRAEGAAEDGDDGGGGSYEMEEPARDLVVALGALSERQRAAVVLHDAAGYPAREIARIVESPEAAIRVHVMRGRRRLRDLLRELDDA